MAFDWLKRKKKAAPRPKRRLPQRRLAPVEEIVEQGLMVADVAVRMNVKNAIILNALGRKADYDEPVSYTHLDVYKRQSQCWGRRLSLRQPLPLRISRRSSAAHRTR